MNTSKNDREIWLCLNFTRLPVEVFNRQQSETPVVVLHRQRVICMNTVAEALGIRLASSMNTAYTISEQIVSVERDEKKEFATLEHLAQWAYQFTPSVVVKAPQCLLLEISGCLKLFRGLDNLKQNIREALTNSVLLQHLVSTAHRWQRSVSPRPDGLTTWTTLRIHWHRLLFTTCRLNPESSSRCSRWALLTAVSSWPFPLTA